MSYDSLQNEMNKKNFKFWYLEAFDDDNQIQELTSEMPKINDFNKKKQQIEKEIQKVSPELRQFYCEPLLNKEQEYHMFRLFNFYKYKAYVFYNRFIQTDLPKMQEKAILFFQKSIDMRNFIVRCNTRLAAKVLKKRKDFYGENVNDLISDCFLNIIKAVDGFDFRRGFKFSTYCIWVLMNNTLREHSQDKRFYDTCCTNIDNAFFSEKIDENEFNASLSFENTEGVSSDIGKILEIIKQKDEREYFVLVNCFGLLGKSKRTLKEISKDLNLTKERVRQIRENSIKYLQGEIHDGNISLSVSNL